MVNFNGNILNETESTLTPSNRGFLFGDAVFETMRITADKILFWEDHYLRLMASMRIMRMDIPMEFTMEYLEDQILHTVIAVNDNSKASRARFTVFRNDGGLYSPINNSVSFVISVSELQTPFYLKHTDFYEVELFKDHYINSGILSTIKTTNKQANILGGIFAMENNYHNCILLNEHKRVVEALNGNLFLVFGNSIKTPPIKEGCLRGIMRKQLLKMGKQLPEYTFEETIISPFELQKADEIFITNVITGIQPISKYRKKIFKSEVASDLLTKLNVKIRLS